MCQTDNTALVGDLKVSQLLSQSTLGGKGGTLFVDFGIQVFDVQGLVW